MKTPKREYKGPLVCWATGELNEYVTNVQESRWKRKNKIAQYKRTIARILAGENLAPELQTAYRFMRLVMSKERKNDDELRFVQCLQMLAKYFSMLAIRHMDSVLNKQRKENAACYPEFDPPHLLRAGERSWLAKKYGRLNRETWQDDLRRGFAECLRVLMPGGVLVFKWNEEQVRINDVLTLAPVAPLFGQRAGKTHWLVFMKGGK